MSQQRHGKGLSYSHIRHSNIFTEVQYLCCFMRFSHLSIYSDLSVYGKHASIRYAFLFELAEAAKKADTTAQWHQPKEMWLMPFLN
ncbi:hypothetical protein, partial [[Clostridium] innocuum]